jgi:hypothetical protein
MRRDDPKGRSDATRRDRSTWSERRLSVRTLMLSCAVVCGLLLALAYGAAAISDALEARVSLVSAAGGATFANAAGVANSTISLALDARPAVRRVASRRAPHGLR